MFNKNIALILLLLSFFLIIGGVSASDNTTVLDIDDNSSYVSKVITNSSLDDGDFDELQSSIKDLKENNTLILEKNYKYSGDKGFNGINIINVNNVTIDGHGHTVDMNNMGRAFKIVNSSVCLKNITFINGNTSGYGGIISASDANLTVSNCIFINDTGLYGGSIYLNNVSLTAFSNVFMNNTAYGSGGCIYCFMSSINSLGDSFISNIASADGGCICFNSNLISQITFGIFLNNTALNGGALSFISNPLYVSSSTFNKNHARFNGNSINNYGGCLYSINNIINKNTSAVISQSEIYGNTLFISMTNQEVYNNLTNETESVISFIKSKRVDENAFVSEKYDIVKPLMNDSEINDLVNDLIKEDNGYTHTSLSAVVNIHTMNDFYKSTTIKLMNPNPLWDGEKLTSYPYSGKKIDMVVFNLEKNQVFNYDSDNLRFFYVTGGSNIVLFNGNNATFKVKNPGDRKEVHLFKVEKQGVLILNNLTITGFNTAIENHGSLFITNTVFDKNRLKYWVDSDDGGAIKNYGYVIGGNCVFMNNYARYGGAIYNSCQVNLTNCYFANNEGYQRGGNLYEVSPANSNFTDCKTLSLTELMNNEAVLSIMNRGCQNITNTSVNNFKSFISLYDDNVSEFNNTTNVTPLIVHDPGMSTLTKWLLIGGSVLIGVAAGLIGQYGALTFGVTLAIGGGLAAAANLGVCLYQHFVNYVSWSTVITTTVSNTILSVGVAALTYSISGAIRYHMNHINTHVSKFPNKYDEEEHYYQKALNLDTSDPEVKFHPGIREKDPWFTNAQVQPLALSQFWHSHICVLSKSYIPWGLTLSGVGISAVTLNQLDIIDKCVSYLSDLL